jgi:DNA-directed RNA polymerase sigma subunit (sigma70/sigma32)
MRRRLDGESLSDIGASLGVSRERVRQLYERGLDRIRSELFKRRK